MDCLAFNLFPKESDFDVVLNFSCPDLPEFGDEYNGTKSAMISHDNVFR